MRHGAPARGGNPAAAVDTVARGCGSAGMLSSAVKRFLPQLLFARLCPIHDIHHHAALTGRIRASTSVRLPDVGTLTFTR